MKSKLAALQQTAVGQFVRKVLDDRAPNLAVLLAWGTLNTLLPLFLGILALAGFVLRDPSALDKLTTTLFSVLPADVATSLESILITTRDNAGVAGLISVILLLFNGTNFFANMQMVFNLAYHVEDRNLVLQRVIALAMLLLVTALILISTSAYGFGTAIESLPVVMSLGPVLGRIISWAISLFSAFVMFLLVYRILPNASQGWRQVLPGTLLATMLFFLLMQLFPLYMNLFGQGFRTYAAFGVFLLLMFWLYLLGLILVLGAELNAFLAQPGRSAALAASAALAEKGHATLRQDGRQVVAEVAGTGTLRRGEADSWPETAAAGQPRPASDAALPRTSLSGKLIGLVGLAIAAVLLRGATQDRTAGA